MSDPLFPAPKYPVPDQPKPEKPPVPKEVNIAFAVWVFSAVASAIVQAVRDADVFVDQFMRQYANQPAAQQLPQGTVKTMFYIALVVVGLLMLFFAWKMRSGRNWARILLTALAVFGLVATVGLTDWLTLASVVVTATGLVYMYMPASNAYFRSFRKVPPAR
ncbi:hypothetical protein ALI144C_45640 [Actinosynnema sp. ALI-1.44]|uniref:hypothetical protein n=1 Tax=Actinosynnema sp. ALI-1.44 TaxID=1933779 RepID=UPI00097C6895|nr:hypothetical protein [Actinosynnema sp. ALI-1.44]ONI73215.1 hypothetical protein ALI144C_45640 [Actinosynnema sp. ALI-1.44]